GRSAGSSAPSRWGSPPQPRRSSCGAGARDRDVSRCDALPPERQPAIRSVLRFSRTPPFPSLARELLESRREARPAREEGRRRIMKLDRCVLALLAVMGLAAAGTGCKSQVDPSDAPDQGPPAAQAPNDDPQTP